jgi:hypothetical protein
MGASQLGEALTQAETDAIVAFLGALTGTLPRNGYPRSCR